MKKNILNKTILAPIFLITFISILSCTQVVSKNSSPKPRVEVSANGMDNDILILINQYRKSIGLPSLQVVSMASQQAYQHSRNMALRRTGFGHEGFENRMAIIGKTEGYISASAENVAYGKLSAEAVVKGWLNSKGHKKNIEGNYAFTGIGVFVDNKGVLFFTQIFFKKA